MQPHQRVLLMLGNKLLDYLLAGQTEQRLQKMWAIGRRISSIIDGGMDGGLFLTHRLFGHLP